MHGSSACLACRTKTKLETNIVGEKLREGSKKKPKGRKPSISEGFWTMSSLDMDNSMVPSQGSISSISTNQTLDPHGGSASSSAPPEFVNHGLLLWNQTRQCWLGSKNREMQPQQIREPKLSWNATYETLLGSSKPFAQPIPLPEMVDFLVDNWEQEGSYGRDIQIIRNWEVYSSTIFIRDCSITFTAF